MPLESWEGATPKVYIYSLTIFLESIQFRYIPNASKAHHVYWKNSIYKLDFQGEAILPYGFLGVDFPILRFFLVQKPIENQKLMASWGTNVRLELFLNSVGKLDL